MGTRSAIGFVEYDGTIRGIYCHYDGYPSHQLPLLTQNYNTIEAVEELLDLGDLSVLDAKIGEKQDFNQRQTGWCLAYGRDRGEKGTEAGEFASRQHFFNHFEGSMCEYFYLFDGLNWAVADRRGTFISAAEVEC